MKDIDKVLEVLNSALAADAAAIHALMINRVPCNQALLDHPSVCVDSVSALGGVLHVVGALGLLNGVVEPLTGERVAMVWKEPESKDGRPTFIGFKKYERPSS